ncbi:hypothetical protein [Lentibacillus amyloliquefaciens]|uniref:Integral membrane protein n=1 Tax=Lentibacillus amyloliquefaciens TaxID=1472767 RepID=A0A0U4E6U7_9BACI|nr:hypothetical protein [Lentibacillus amyloliquefaciens]ALX48593.1 hypothetical protein AOX59_08195 [Lentibacillus amyloliquefaciens]
MELLIKYQWEIFITIEVLSVAVLLFFGVIRYLFGKYRLSRLFLFGFLILLGIEAVLAILIYRETGEISTFQIIITVFVLYACTFGIVDFLKLDRWMRKTIGRWRGVELLTDKDYRIMERNKDPKFIAKKYRWSSTAHLVVFAVVQCIFWTNGTDSFEELLRYLTDFSWVESGTAADSPYANETVYGIGMVWGIVFAVDFLYSWSYTLFPSSSLK